MNDINIISRRIKEADAILIGASNGLSITEGLNLFADNEAFRELFSDMREKYGIGCILQGMSYPWKSPEESWTFWSRLIKHYCVDYHPSQAMDDLRGIVGDKDYYVITSNGEGHFRLCGMDRVYEIEGSWLDMHCSSRCHNGLYSTLEAAKKLAEVQDKGLVPKELIPVCNKCGSPMMVNMIGEDFIQYTREADELNNFLARNRNKKLVVMELGIGWRNRLIKAPLMELVRAHPMATYITINLGEIYVPDDIRDKSFGLDGTIAEKLMEIRGCM